jgi:hypothetical protein
MVADAVGEGLHAETGYSSPPMLPDLKPLADLELVDHTGRPVRFGNAWEAGPALLVFLRHYG